jgi:guanosine-3',5'-bis(diphosphate) 3'-pyrophosphohydrolase
MEGQALCHNATPNIFLSPQQHQTLHGQKERGTNHNTKENEMTDHTVGMAKIARAMAFAARKHRGQRRKDRESSPYINHPIALASILADEAEITDPDVICAALLHDTIEDTDTSAEELREIFGDAVTSIVLEVTDDKSLSKQDRKQQQIEHTASISSEAKMVKLADKIANLRDIATMPPATWDTERKQEYFDWAAKVIDKIRGTHTALETLFDAALASSFKETSGDCLATGTPTPASSKSPLFTEATLEAYGKGYILGAARPPKL